MKDGAVINRVDVTLGMNLGKGNGVCYTEEISGQKATPHWRQGGSQPWGGGINPDKTPIKYKPWARLPDTKALGAETQLGDAVAKSPGHSAVGCCHVYVALVFISVRKVSEHTSF